MDGPSGIVVKVLTQHMKDLGSSHSWIQVSQLIWLVNHTGVKNVYSFLA